MASAQPDKEIWWIASTLDDLREMSEEVRSVIGFALRLAQRGESHPDSRKMRGDLHDVIEIVISDAGDAFRAMYTVKLKGAVYVLHVFQKKSKKGIATPQADLNLIRKRLKDARKHYEENYSSSNRAQVGDKKLHRRAI